MQDITLYIFITVLCGTHSIPQNVLHIQTECREYLGILHEIFLVPQNIVMNLNNVMEILMTHEYLTTSLR